MPVVFKIIVNILLYIFYTIFFQFIFGLIFPLFLKLLGREIPNPTDPIFVKISIFIAIFVLIVSIFFRKYFYLSFESVKKDNEGEDSKVYKVRKKEDNIDFKDKDDLEIFIWKEK